MGNDHRRKMAVVTALKQYAEDRDIAILCSALGDTLRTPAQRKILTQIRCLLICRIFMVDQAVWSVQYFI